MMTRHRVSHCAGMALISSLTLIGLGASARADADGPRCSWFPLNGGNILQERCQWSQTPTTTQVNVAEERFSFSADGSGGYVDANGAVVRRYTDEEGTYFVTEQGLLNVYSD